MYKYHQYPIIGSWYKVKTSSYYKIAYLILTFDLLTLTWGQHRHLIVINHVCKYHQYPTIGLWYIVDSIFKHLHIWPWPLTLWPWPLVNFNILFIHTRCISIINIWSLVHDKKSKRIFFTKFHFWPSPLTLWPWL